MDNKKEFTKPINEREIPVTDFTPERLYVKPETDEVIEESKTTKSAEKITIGKVYNCGSLNIRAQPNINSEIVNIVKKDTTVAIVHTKSTDGWYKVIVDSKLSGFCMKDFIKDTGSISR